MIRCDSVQIITLFMFQFLAARNPENLGWIVKWFEEVYLVLNSLLQAHYLHYNGMDSTAQFKRLQLCF